MKDFNNVLLIYMAAIFIPGLLFILCTDIDVILKAVIFTADICVCGVLRLVDFKLLNRKDKSKNNG